MSFSQTFLNYSCPLKRLMKIATGFHNLRLFFTGLTTCIALCSASAVLGQTMAPDELVRKLTEDVLAAVKANENIQAGSVSQIQALVESKVLPYVNFRKMTASAVGRNWSQATPEQQKQITDQFRQLLIYTYSGALAKVRDQEVQYRPFRSDPADNIVQVEMRIINKGEEPIQLKYKLEKGGSDWKITDVNILGVWLVENYRNTFQQEVTRGGIDGLIKTLAQKNQSLANAANRRVR